MSNRNKLTDFKKVAMFKRQKQFKMIHFEMYRYRYRYNIDYLKYESGILISEIITKNNGHILQSFLK